MSLLQRFFTAIFPRRWAESMEAHSRSWMVRCGRCGFAQSIWEMGGIRWKAGSGGRTATFLKCTQCGQRSWHKVTRDPQPPKM
jgi:hypothetical protein